MDLRRWWHARRGGGDWRGGIGGEILLALLATLVVLGAIVIIEQVAHERVLFASLASSAFLIYRDPLHPMNGIRVMLLAHLIGAALGVGAALLLGAGYAASATAMVAAIAILIACDLVHPPAISTALGFAFSEQQRNAGGVFVSALILVAALIVLQRIAAWTVARLAAQSGAHGEGRAVAKER